VPYGTDDYLLCPISSRGLQLSRAQLPQLPPMRTATASFRAGRLGEAQYLARVQQFWRRLGVSLAGAPRPAAPAPQAAPAAGPAQAGPGPGNQASWVAQLAELAQLRDQGVISDDDYAAAKRRLLQRH